VAHYRLLEVADGVHAAIDVPGGGAAGNAAIVDLGGSTLVFDTGMTPQAGAELRRAAEEVAPVSVVVNSHWHADHIRGNQAFPGTEIVATTRTKELIETRGIERLAEHKAFDVEAYLASLPDGPERGTVLHMAAGTSRGRWSSATGAFSWSASPEGGRQGRLHPGRARPEVGRGAAAAAAPGPCMAYFKRKTRKRPSFFAPDASRRSPVGRTASARLPEYQDAVAIATAGARQSIAPSKRLICMPGRYGVRRRATSPDGVRQAGTPRRGDSPGRSGAGQNTDRECGELVASAASGRLTLDARPQLSPQRRAGRGARR